MRAVVAGAGAGKTRHIVERVRDLVASQVAPADILVVSYTRAAAAELRTRIDCDGVRVATLHATAWSSVREHLPDVGVWSESAQLRDMCRRVPADFAPSVVAEAARWTEHDQALEGWEPPAEFVLPPGITGNEVRDAMVESQCDRLSRGRLTYADLLGAAVAIAEHVRPSPPKFVLVDEAQDLSPLQARLLGVWADLGADILLVGDPAQAIYGFRGGSPAALASVPDPELLMDNFRSADNIVTVSSRLRPDGLRMVTQRNIDGRVRLHHWPSRRLMLEGIPAPTDQAMLLARTNDVARALGGLTIHAAKGLEWDRVHVVDLIEGRLPAARTPTPELLAEERRVLYVAATRARDELDIHTVTGRESRFVELLGDEVDHILHA